MPDDDTTKTDETPGEEGGGEAAETPAEAPAPTDEGAEAPAQEEAPPAEEEG